MGFGVGFVVIVEGFLSSSSGGSSMVIRLFPGASRSSPSNRARTTVMLSSPPRLFASSINRSHAFDEVVLAVHDDLLNIVRPQFAGQSVAAKQHDVSPVANPNFARDGVHVALRAQRLKYYVAEHVCLRFRLADLAHVHELLNERLVLRGKTNVVLANDVAATIANLNEIEAITSNGGARERCAHAGTARVFLAAMMNREVRVDRGVFQTLNQVQIGIARSVAFAANRISFTESTAIRLATSPASAPPMPSDTTSTSPLFPRSKRVSLSGGVAPSVPIHVCSDDRSRTRKLSSLPRRTRPTSVLANNSTIIRQSVSGSLLKVENRVIVTPLLFSCHFSKKVLGTLCFVLC